MLPVWVVNRVGGDDGESLPVEVRSKADWDSVESIGTGGIAGGGEQGRWSLVDRGEEVRQVVRVDTSQWMRARSSIDLHRTETGR